MGVLLDGLVGRYKVEGLEWRNLFFSRASGFCKIVGVGFFGV